MKNVPRKQQEDLRNNVQAHNRFEPMSKKKEEAIPVNALVGQWEPIILTMDSGAGNNVAPRNAFPWIALEPNDDSRAGKYYLAANGKRVYVLGEKVVTLRMPDGRIKKMRFQIADVTRVLVSIGKVTQAGNDVTMSAKGGKVVDKLGNEYNMELENGVYVMKCELEKATQRFLGQAQ